MIRHHVAGVPIVLPADAERMRVVQRCAVCGKKLVDYMMKGDPRGARVLRVACTVKVVQAPGKEEEAEELNIAFVKVEPRCGPD